VLALLGAVALSFAVYAHTLGGDFVYDDIPLLVDNDCHRARLSRLFDFSRPTLCNQRPLRFISFALDHAIWGQRPLGYRVTNLILHGLVSFLALLVLWRVCGDATLAFVGALLFLLHPIATEAVAYISGRRDLLLALFSLSAALAVLPAARAVPPAIAGGAENRDPIPLSPGRALAGGLALLCAFLSHESAVALPFALLVVALALRWPAEPTGWRKGLARALSALRAERRLWALLALVVFALAFAGWSLATRNPSTRHALWGEGIGGHVATVLRVHAHYLRQLALPTDLIADYSPQAFRLSRSLFEPSALVALALCVGLLAGALWLWARRAATSGWRLAGAAVLVYFALLVPQSQIAIHHELAAEHRLYLPSLCFSALVAAGLIALARRLDRRWLLVPVCGGLALALALLTVGRAMVWTSAELLWSTTVERVPRCARAQANLGAIYAGQGRLDAGRRHLERALALRPNLCTPRLNLGQLLVHTGKVKRGLVELRRGVRCRPGPSAYAALASIELELGLAARAERSARAGLRYRRLEVGLRYLLGRALQRQGKLDAALAAYQRVLFRRPGHVRSRLQIAAIRAIRCELSEARRLAAALRKDRRLRRSRQQALERLLRRALQRCRRPASTAPATPPP